MKLQEKMIFILNFGKVEKSAELFLKIKSQLIMS